MRKLIVHIVVLLLAFPSFSQTTQTIVYTTKEGLASNSVYRTMLDKRGFLWIATDIGISRFDGRIFRTYTTAQGLPDNEIVDILLDSAGQVWAIPFGKPPSYYNQAKDRFENSTTDPELAKINMANTSTANVLDNGGMAFSNNQRSLYIYKDHKVKEYSAILDKDQRIQPPIRVYQVNGDQLLVVCLDSFRYLVNGKLVAGDRISPALSLWCEKVKDVLYIGQSNTITKFRIDDKGIPRPEKTKDYPFQIRILGYTGKQPTITSVNDITYLLNAETLELSESISSGSNVRNVLQDDYGNSWLSSRESGLIKVQQKRISSFTALPVLQQNFNAIIKTGNLYITGNNKGEVYAYDGVYGLTKTSLTPAANSDTWVRNIINLRQGIYVATQTGSYLFNTTGNRIQESFQGPKNRSSKAALLINDSTMAMGTHSVTYKVHLPDFRITDSIRKRVVSLAADRNGQVYIGSNDGLYRWEGGGLYYYGTKQKGLTYKINTMCSTPDELIFVGPGADSLFVLRNRDVVAGIALGDIIPGNTCKSLLCSKAGEVWLGTNKGLSRIRYTFNNGKFNYSNTAFGIADGLSGEQVNAIFSQRDTVYLATNGGISYLPAEMRLPVADIQTFITRVTINGKDTAVSVSYDLPYDMNDISIEFSAVDLTGYHPVFQYSINDGNWLRLERSVLELRRLAPGASNIKIRTLKRDGSPSTQTASINIYINTPFWKNGIFWSFIALFIFLGSIFFLQRRNRQKQQAAVEKVVTEKKLSELEMQALKAQINPHFVFNCLNSIKGFLFDGDFKQADKYLDKFSELLRSTLDNSSSAIISLEEEMRYLDNYLQLETLRFDDKFTYFVAAGEDLDRQHIFVPAMLLQPYVENAIRHGIRHLESRKGQICIEIEKKEGKLFCSIDDDGVGRKKALQLRNETHTEYQSRGMQISKRRAELYGIEEIIVDKYDAAGNASGTTIILKIPLDLQP